MSALLVNVLLVLAPNTICSVLVIAAIEDKSEIYLYISP